MFLAVRMDVISLSLTESAYYMCVCVSECVRVYVCLYGSTCICRCERDVWAFICFWHNSLSLTGCLVVCVKERKGNSVCM